jgi:diguanylate cyclase (GGDEF)-like protein
MHDLLRQIESITGCRDRESLAAHLLRAVRGLLGEAQIVLLDVESTREAVKFAPFAEATADGVRFLRSDGERSTFRLNVPPAAVERTVRAGEPVLEESDTRFHCLFPLRALNLSSAAGCLAISAPRPATAEEIEALSWFVRIYGNYIGLLDYSEFDTLTRLLNRKTFDDAFDRLLARAYDDAAQPAGDERRGHTGSEWWLAVIDIDHFKRVNDNFGHLFGDEVLLRVANLMRESFRGYDLLFRFGGEEFVAMLQTASREGAEIALDRFRRAVEDHVFPQVGQVTCSVGYTAVDPLKAQPDLLGQADAALYWCKQNGRNRIGGYEVLVADGRLKPVSAEAVQPDIDIDALFA